jgi:FKBP-type peptidyl-prolyl cis-trans isomerase FkpA
MKKARLFFQISLLLLIASACSTYSDQDKQQFDKKIQDYLTKKKIKCLRSDSGLYYTIIEPGEGKIIQYLDSVSFTYSGTFLNDKKFDEQKKPVQFAVKDLIGAWKEIMLELKPGATAFIVAPPHLGYGQHQLDDIPANSILAYTLTIHHVK